MPEKLPIGWTQTTLGEIVEPLRARALPSENPEIPYVGLEHIEPKTMRLKGHGYAYQVRSSSVRFSEGDVLYARMRPYLNKVWIAEFDGLCSGEFLVFPKSAWLNSEFIGTRLNSDDFVTFANGQASGERPRVDFQKLARFPVLLPPLAEQARIVAKMKVALSGVETAVMATNRAQERLKRYRAAVLRTAITGELTKNWRDAQRKETKPAIETGNALLQRLLESRSRSWQEAELERLQTAGKTPKDEKWRSNYRPPAEPRIADSLELPKGWSWASVDQLAAHEERSITDGPFGSNLKTVHYTNSGPRVVRLQNIGDGEFIDEKAHISRKHYQLLGNYAVHAGDLVIRALGTPAPRACKIPDWLGPAIVKADCIRFKVASEFVSSKYVMWALNSPPVRERTDKLIHGIGRPRLNLGEIKSIALPLPPFEEQSAIVTEVTRRFAAAEQLARTLELQLIRADDTRQALLREAFVGHLSPQNPTDEPASSLIECIRIERKATVKKPKGSHMPKSRSKTHRTRRPLLDILREQEKPITPEELFRSAGFEPSQVDEFYRELASLRDQLVEHKPRVSDVKLWPHRATVNLRLKAEAMNEN